MDIDFTTGEWIKLQNLICDNNNTQTSISKTPYNEVNFLPSIISLSVIGSSLLNNLNVSGLSSLNSLSLTPELITTLDLSNTMVNFYTIVENNNVNWNNLTKLIAKNSLTDAIRLNEDPIDRFPILNYLDIRDCDGFLLLDITGVPIKTLLADRYNITSVKMGSGIAELDFSTGEWTSL